jgi:putative ABC transport system permease protein
MTGRGLSRSVRDDLTRHWRHIGAGALGIAMSVAALVFFLSLGLGVREVLLGEVFPVDRIEVHRKSTDLNLFALKIELGKDTIDDAVVAKLEAIEGVAAVYPKMRLLVPAMASGGESLIGQGMQTELVADGIDPSLVANEIGEAFHDPRLDPGVTGRPCTQNSACPDGTVCAGVTAFGPGECREEIPVIVSEHMVELYNGAFRRAYRLPKVNPQALLGLGLDVSFGASSLRPSGRRVTRDRVTLVGFSDAAIPLGITMPLGFVQRLNDELGPDGAAEGYHSAVVEIASKDAATNVVEAIEQLGLDVRDGGARRAAFFMTVLLTTVSLVGIAILAISALHVMHVFALLVMIRRREIGVMRAVGASRGDVRLLLMTEAAVVGFAAGVCGLVVASALAWAADRALISGLPDFPFKPESFFAFDPWLLAAGLGVAVVSCVLGSLAPSLRATGPDPAEVLSST